jgi:hypothetical protein
LHFDQALNSTSNDTNSKTTTDEQSGKDEGILDELLVTSKPEAENADEAEPGEAGESDQPDEVVSKINIDAVAHEEEEMETVTVIFFIL